ncbi:MAG: hypothetical protein NTW87_23140 [Planctomycetota bacterium]|nr:hypothetical protein [Planctomycetota bacterium]
MEPCGIGNPRPLLAVCGVSISSPPQLMGRDESHLSFFVRQGSTVRRVVGFGAAEHFNALCDLGRHGTLDIAFRPQVSKYGAGSVELIMEAFRTGC